MGGKNKPHLTTEGVESVPGKALLVVSESVNAGNVGELVPRETCERRLLDPPLMLLLWHPGSEIVRGHL